MKHLFTTCATLLLVTELGWAQEAEVFRKTLRTQGQDGVHTYRIPGLTTSKQGTLVAVFDLRNKNGGDLPADIDVGMMRSTDAGVTWTGVTKVMDFPADEANARGNGVGDPCVVADLQTGDLFIFALWSQGNRAWHGSGPGLKPAETGQLLVVKSTDDGATWSQPINLTAQVKQPEWLLLFNGPGAGIQLRGGQLVIPAQYKDAQKVPHSCFLASEDHGTTWKISPPAIPNQPPTSESAIVELKDGSLLLSMRNEAHVGERSWATWSWQDKLANGKWSEPWLALPDPTCMASVLRHPSGALIFSNPNHAKKRAALTVRSSDDGKSWSNGRLVDAGGAMYSCLTVLKDGQLGLLYESAAEAGLVFVRFPLAWVRGAE